MHSVASSIDTTYTPFGSPDAANEAIPAPFELAELSAYAQMAATGFDSLARVLVGKMGTGKTRYLIELRNLMGADGSCELTEIESDLPNLTAVTRLAENLQASPVERAEIWRKIWERAIVNATLSWMVPSVDRSPSLVYGEFARILRDHPTVPGLRNFLDDPAWDSRVNEFERVLKSRSRPICFFLDAFEEDSAHAPLYWLWCQKGLVTQVLRYARRPELADKLRIFICIRDQTWTQLQQTVGSARLEQHPVVRVLKWDAHLIADFLGYKIGRLTADYLLAESTEPNGVRNEVAGWLGTRHIENQTREDVTDYILRHTRLNPRDIVTLGNLLARQTFAAKRRNETRLSDERIRDAITESARASAAEELQWCGLELISKQLARSSSILERRQIAPDEDAAGRATDKLKSLLRQCGNDIFPVEQFRQFEREATDVFGPAIEFAPLLWRHGLLGWGDSAEGPFAFITTAKHTQAIVPPDGSHVAMHPILIDALSLAITGRVLVVPFGEDELP